jgi:hypothetical protein
MAYLEAEVLERDRGIGREVLASGALAGLIAGTVMAAVAIAYEVSTGAGAFLTPKLIAAAFLGVNALIGGAGVVALGVAVHLAVSAFWGIVFAALLPRDSSTPVGLTTGVMYGAAIWVVMTFLALPALDPVMRERVALGMGVFAAEHVLFGAVLGWALSVLRFAPDTEPD